MEWSYAVVVDAGSTGSRLFLYQYRSVTDQQLINIIPVVDQATFRPVVKKVTPGLSSFGNRPQDAAGSSSNLFIFGTGYFAITCQAS